MADNWGAVAIPVPVPGDGEAVSDPGLDILLAFLQAVVNAELGAAWDKRSKGELPIAQTFSHNPEGPPIGFFNDRKTPALYGYRKGGPAPFDLSDEFRVAVDVLTFLWVPSDAKQAFSGPRTAFINGLTKVVDEALWNGRHPAYQRVGDPDPTATTVAPLPTSVLLSKATLTAPHTYSGAGLDGSIGASAITPPRAVTITLGGDPTAFLVGSTITVNGLDVLGFSQVETFTIATGTETFQTLTGYTAITSVVVDAQTFTTGTLEVGTAAHAGRGTVLLTALKAHNVMPQKQAAWRYLSIKQERGPALTYAAIEFAYTVREVRTRDAALFVASAARYSLTRADGSVIETSAL